LGSRDWGPRRGLKEGFAGSRSCLVIGGWPGPVQARSARVEGESWSSSNPGSWRAGVESFSERFEILSSKGDAFWSMMYSSSGFSTGLDGPIMSWWDVEVGTGIS
jgi:hypothetical protein